MAKKNYVKNLFPYLGLCAVIIIFWIWTKGACFSENNVKAMINSGLYTLVASAGFCFLLAEGMLDISISSTMCLGCIVAALLAQINPALGIAGAVGAGALVGSVNGILQIKLQIPSMVQGVALKFALDGIAVLMLGGSTLAAPLFMRKWYTTEFKLIFLFAVIAGGYVLFEYTPYGRKCKAVVKENRETARQSGIHVNRMIFLPYLVMGILAGILGFVSLIRTGTATYNTGASLYFDVLIACLLGGMPITGGSGTKFRSILIGSVTITILMGGMQVAGLSSNMQQLVKAVIFLLAIGMSFDRKGAKVIK